MRIILSRKGFDSSAGGCPSPILPDGRLLALPIPDPRSRIRYADLQLEGVNSGRLVSQLTRGRIKGSHGAHLDPDLVFEDLLREPGWRPLLGQTGSAQGHLRKQGISEGDLFLFFGLFREAEIVNRRWRFVPGSRPRHILWGWLQIGEIINIDTADLSNRKWLHYHPHLHGETDANNTLYLARKSLNLDGMEGVDGSGTFARFNPLLQLTKPGSGKPTCWQLPDWFYPGERSPLSYHAKPERWQLQDGFCELQCAARGQEFVLNADVYPEWRTWFSKLLHRST